MREDEPDLIWIPANIGYGRLFYFACVVFIALLAVRLWRTDSASPRWSINWAMSMLEGIITDPMLWVACGAVVYGNYRWGSHSLLFRCPHCGCCKDAPDALVKAAIGTRWKCDKCGNSSAKGTTPPLPRGLSALRDLPPEMNRIGAHRYKAKQR